MIQVLIVDDQELVRAGFRALLDSDPDITVVGEASDGDEAVELTEDVDVVLMDIRMPRMSGIEATRRIRRQPDPPEVLVLTTFDTDENAFEALEAGAAGFLVKDTPPVQLLEAVKSAAAGGAFISPATTRRLIDHLIAAGRKNTVPSLPPTFGSLTERELEVLRLIAQGFSNRDIAERLSIAELTAKTHVSRLLTKLGVESRVQAAVLAHTAGLMD